MSWQAVLDETRNDEKGPRMIPTINPDRLWQSIMGIAEIGPTPDSGSCRLALTAEDTAARTLFLRWCQPLSLNHGAGCDRQHVPPPPRY